MYYTTPRFSIKYGTRPPRFAYILENDKNSSSILDQVFNESYERWGGLKTLIIPVKDGKIGNDYMSWLQYYDPDIIYNYTYLSPHVLSSLDEICCPALFLNHRSPTNDPDYKINFIKSGSLLSKLVAHKQTRSILLPKDSSVGELIMSRIKDIEHYPRVLPKGVSLESEFLTDNFGSFTNKIMPIDACETLIALICGYDGYHSSYLSGIDTYMSTIQFSKEKFGTGIKIFIGDSFDDRLNFWNARHSFDEYRHIDPASVAIRIPSHSLNNKNFFILLNKYMEDIHKEPNFDIISYSLPMSELDKVQKLLKGEIRILNPYDFIPTINFEEKNTFTNYGNEISTSDPSIKISNPEPNHFCYLSHKEKLDHLHCSSVVEVQIGLSDNISGNKMGILKLPKRKAAAIPFTEEKLARINLEGNLSIIDFSKWWSNVKNELSLKFSPDKQVFDSIFENQANYAFGDARTCNTLSKITYSDKGRSFLTSIKFFDQLDCAFSYIDEAFWRDVFAELGDQNKMKASPVLRREIKKKMDRQQFSNLSTDEQIDKIIDYSYGISKKEESISLKELESKFNKYIEAKKIQKDVPADKYLVECLSFLTSKKIFYQVCKVKCLSCGNNPWISVDELNLQNTCTVCGEQNQLPVTDLEWQFVMNRELARHLHDTMVEIWTLGQLKKDCQRSFLFIPQCNIAIDQVTKKEIDIICIKDGSLMIGEAKKKASEFAKSDIEKLLLIAEHIRPDKVILSYIENDKDNDKDIEQFIGDITVKGFKVELVTPL